MRISACREGGQSQEGGLTARTLLYRTRPLHLSPANRNVSNIKQLGTGVELFNGVDSGTQ